MKTGSILLILMFGLMGLTSCQSSDFQGGFSAAAGLESLPKTYENPDHNVDSETPPTADSIKTEDQQTTSTEGQTSSNQDSTKSTTNDKKDEHVVTTEPVSKLILNAEKIMISEGRKIGTACNLYVQRVLEVSGFKRVDFLANDFDQYAKKYFKYYKAVEFKHDSNGAEVIHLKRHIWSYPERTPFILQWSRSSAHGHIAIMERIGEKLVIYQASLGQHIARKDLTTPEILLTGYNRRIITVYSEMTPR